MLNSHDIIASSTFHSHTSLYIQDEHFYILKSGCIKQNVYNISRELHSIRRSLNLTRDSFAQQVWPSGGAVTNEPGSRGSIPL